MMMEEDEFDDQHDTRKTMRGERCRKKRVNSAGGWRRKRLIEIKELQ